MAQTDAEKFWTGWNAVHRTELAETARDERDAVRAGLDATGRRDLDILEVGCGIGWLCPLLGEFGAVTATDIVSDHLARAQERMPSVRFIAGDFMSLPLTTSSYDIIVCLEVLSHMSDQRAFVAKLAQLLRPGGRLLLATQNRAVFERHMRVAAPAPGQVRRWLNREELEDLLSERFDIESVYSMTPIANRGVMRFVNAGPLHRFPLLGARFKRFKERRGLGCNLMCVAVRRPLTRDAPARAADDRAASAH